jgi:diguanylate cyclase (GGDEF)-like protein/PAS domain S-box-containing protein
MKPPHILAFQLFLVGVAYFATAKLGLLLPYENSVIALIWLPSGIAAAAIFRFGVISVIPIYIAALLVEMTLHLPVTTAANIALGNALAPLTAAFFLQYFRFSPKLIGVRDILLMITAAFFGMLISSSIGTLSLYMSGLVKASGFFNTWLTWWLADSVGVLLVLPLVLNFNTRNLSRIWKHRYPFLAWFVCYCLIEGMIFRLVPNANNQFAVSTFLIVPMLIWAAMRFGIVGSSFVVLSISIISVWITAAGFGPFVQQNTNQGIFSLWFFIITLIVILLLVSILESRRELTQLALKGNEAKLRALVNGAFDGIVTTDEQGTIVEFNPAAERIFGFVRDNVVGRPLSSVIVPPKYREAHIKAHHNFITTGDRSLFDKRIEMQALKADGTEIPVEVTLVSMHEQGLPYITSFIRDITDRIAAEKEINQLAFYDALTNLPNRRLFQDRLQQALVSSHRTKNMGALIFIDLDNFKKLNDTKGHATGDLLLKEVAKRLKKCVRAEDTVARLGGDEFVIVLENLSHDADKALSFVSQVGEKLLADLGQTYLFDDLDFKGSSSIGVTLFSGYNTNLTELLKQADTAMYDAKAAGKNTLRFYNPELQGSIESSLLIESQLRNSIKNKQLNLFYQKQVDAYGNAFGAEVLLRWNHPERGSVPPVEFIPIAEANNQIIPIGRWVMHEACLQLKKWEANDNTKHLILAVNVSAKQFLYENFLKDLKQTLQETEANPKLLQLELTETSLIGNIETVVEKMLHVRDLGISIAIDDFGTGHSSLVYLKKLPVSQIKIDRSFVRDIAIDSNDLAIVKMILAIGNTLGMDVIAEGVEKNTQVKLLKQHGCKQFQGFLYGKPMSITHFEHALNSKKPELAEEKTV